MAAAAAARTTTADRRGSASGRKPRAHAGHLWPVPPTTPSDPPALPPDAAATPSDASALPPDAAATPSDASAGPRDASAVVRDASAAPSDASVARSVAGTAAEPGVALPVTVSITIDGGDPAGRERVLSALRELVAVAGGVAGAAVAVGSAGNAGAAARRAAEEAGSAAEFSAAEETGSAAEFLTGEDARLGATHARGWGAPPADARPPAGGATPVLSRPAFGVATPPAAGGTPVPTVITIDPKPRTIARDGWPLHLSRLEYDLLLFLAQHPRQVFSRTQLLAQVWGHTHTTLRTVDVHVSRLRGKLDGQELITTVYGLGYRLADDAVITVAA